MASSSTTSYPKDKIKILFLENISEAAIRAFRDAGYSDIKKISGALSEDQLIQEIKNVHMIGIRSKTQITERVLQHAEKLQAIGCFCIGTNQVNLTAARKGEWWFLTHHTAIPDQLQNWLLEPLSF